MNCSFLYLLPNSLFSSIHLSFLLAPLSFLPTFFLLTYHPSLSPPSLSLPPKVETIGDAYMVVGGLPQRNRTHAECVANQGLDMMYYCRRVCRPDNGNPIRVSVTLAITTKRNHLIRY